MFDLEMLLIQYFFNLLNKHTLTYEDFQFNFKERVLYYADEINMAKIVSERKHSSIIGNCLVA